MEQDKNPNFFSTIFSRGNYELLKFIEKSEKPLQFKDLKFIKNPKTLKKYSTRTISEALKTLESKNLIKNEIIKEKRKIIAYKPTEEGKKLIKILKETEDKLNKLI